MNPGNLAAIAYGILALVGGIMGYAKANSKVSLASGSISGILLVVSGLLSWFGQSWGLILAAAIAGVLVVVFSVRLVKTRKFMPAGMMLIAGIAALVAIATQLS